MPLHQEDVVQGADVPVVYIHLGDDAKWAYAVKPPAEEAAKA